MKERLQKVMAHSGVASRRESEQLILAGKVKINGQVVKKLGTKVDPNTDKIEVSGNLVAEKEPLVYYIVNKPRGYITTVKDERGRKTVLDLVKGINKRVYPVGRLDYETEGLLLLTNDGRLAHELMHPRFHVPKTYLVKVKGKLTPEAVGLLRQGVKLDDGPTSPAQVEVIQEDERYSLFKITIHEGRNRQVRRMCKAIGFDVLNLVRTQFGPLAIGSLKTGQWRSLSSQEIAKLKQAVRKKWKNKS